jgi:hypothetical protein
MSSIIMLKRMKSRSWGERNYQQNMAFFRNPFPLLGLLLLLSIPVVNIIAVIVLCLRKK